jgi:hypothetical protein
MITLEIIVDKFLYPRSLDVLIEPSHPPSVPLQNYIARSLNSTVKLRNTHPFRKYSFP